MYISILDYSNGTVSIINDEEDLTNRMDEAKFEALLSAIGYNPNAVMWMLSENDPYEQVEDYVTLDTLLRDVDKDEKVAFITKER